MESASVPVGGVGHTAHDDHHHGPPEAHESSKIDRQTLGILLFIVSEAMLFGAFFASYFFIRAVANDGGAWPPEPYELPVLVAGINTVILVASSFTVHWALEGVRRENHFALKAGLGMTWLLGFTFLFIQINEYVHIGFSARDGAFGSIFYGLTGLHGAHVFVGLLLLTFANIRAWRGHFGPKAKDHLGVEVPGIYWHFVDVMWIIVYASVYLL
jgi:cytochrome c oxidase subunit 3